MAKQQLEIANKEPTSAEFAEAANRLTQQVTASRERARAYLQELGMVDARGRLTANYR